MPDNITPGHRILTLDASMALPLGTEVVDAEGYWRGRTYVKTGQVTWAHFSARPTPEELRQAVEERRNNLSPGNLYTLVHVYEPDTPMTGLSKPDPSQAVASPSPMAETTGSIKAAAEAMEDAALRLTGRDFGTIYRDRIANETVAAAINAVGFPDVIAGHMTITLTDMHRCACHAPLAPSVDRYMAEMAHLTHLSTIIRAAILGNDQ